MEIKTEADISDITEYPHNDHTSTGMCWYYILCNVHKICSAGISVLFCAYFKTSQECWVAYCEVICAFSSHKHGCRLFHLFSCSLAQSGLQICRNKVELSWVEFTNVNYLYMYYQACHVVFPRHRSRQEHVIIITCMSFVHRRKFYHRVSTWCQAKYWCVWFVDAEFSAFICLWMTGRWQWSSDNMPDCSVWDHTVGSLCVCHKNHVRWSK